MSGIANTDSTISRVNLACRMSMQDGWGTTSNKQHACRATYQERCRCPLAAAALHWPALVPSLQLNTSSLSKLS